MVSVKPKRWFYQGPSLNQHDPSNPVSYQGSLANQKKWVCKMANLQTIEILLMESDITTRWRFYLAVTCRTLLHLCQEPMTPGYPVLGQGSSIQENWFQNRTQRPRFAIEGHPTRYGFGKNKTWFLGSRTHDPWVPSFGSGVIDTGKLVSKSDSATPICYRRTPNTIWFRQKQNLVFGVTNPWPLGTQFWVRGHRYRKTGFKFGFSDPDLL